MRIAKAGWIGIVGSVVLGLTLFSCRPKPSSTIVADPALMPLVPSDTKILVGVRVTELKKTDLYQRLMKEGKLPQVELFKQETGIDLKKDIWEVVTAFNGQQSVTFVRGKFTEGGVTDSGMEPTLDKKGIKRSGYRGYTFQGDDRVVVTFLNSSVAVAGSIPAVQSVIDARDGGKGKPPESLLNRIKQISSENQIWAVSDTDWEGTIPEDIDGPLGMLKQIPVKLKNTAAMLNLSNGIKLTGELIAEDTASSQKLSLALQGILGIGRMMIPQDEPELNQLYESLQISSEKEMIRIQADIPEKVFEDFLEEHRILRLAPVTPQ